MLLNKYPLCRSGHGFSLVEIMIAVVVGMVGILVIMQVFLVAEGQKRTTTGGADAQENALMAMFTLERELRISGLGLVGLGCTTINGYNANMAPTTYSFNPWPVTIARDTPAAGSDRITLLYSNSPFANIATTITTAAPTSSAQINAANGDGFVQGNLFVVSSPPLACTVLQASQDGQKTGSDWNVQHNPGGAYIHNPPGGQNIFPAGGYPIGARLTNMGSMVNHEYYVQNNNLMMRDVSLPNSATNPIALVNGMVAIRAQYGRDTNADGYVDVYDNTAPASATDVVAVRLAVVSRSGQLETTAVSPATLVLWTGGTVANGGAIALNAAAQLYRYKSYQTTIPLRNVLWNN
jgi:type IV pilus assembly protein PilW